MASTFYVSRAVLTQRFAIKIEFTGKQGSLSLIKKDLIGAEDNGKKDKSNKQNTADCFLNVALLLHDSSFRAFL
jgi:hypothetical protein